MKFDVGKTLKTKTYSKMFFDYERIVKTFEQSGVCVLIVTVDDTGYYYAYRYLCDRNELYYLGVREEGECSEWEIE